MSESKKRKHGRGLYWTVGRYTFGANVARSGTWGEDVEGAARVYLLSAFHAATQYPDGRTAKRLNLILGPFVFIVGWMA